MKKRLRLMSIISAFMAATFLCAGLSHGEEEEMTVTGEIIEIASNENIIQVGNRNYIVMTVLIDDGSAKAPVAGRFGNLKVGSLVEIYVGKKSEGFWKADKVVLFLGSKRQEIMKERQ
jgi:hypothetical protein